MAFSSPPTTPDRLIQPSVRRSFTAPIRVPRNQSPSVDGQAQESETLFAADTAKIISFTATDPSGRPFPPTFGHEWAETEEPVGILPWGSLTERTVASGPLRIYRVMSSIVFLSSANVVKPMLAKSQCWCVDGVSKFVMRVRGMSFYRIELPCDNPEEEAQVEQLKEVLERVLQYEKTACPFKRSFTVELPKPPETPVKMVPWRPKVGHRMSTSDVFVINKARENGNMDKARAISISGATAAGPIKMEFADLESPPKKVADFPDEQSPTESTTSSDQTKIIPNARSFEHMGAERFYEIREELETNLKSDQHADLDHNASEATKSKIIPKPDGDRETALQSDGKADHLAESSHQSSPDSFYSSFDDSSPKDPSRHTSPDMLDRRERGLDICDAVGDLPTKHLPSPSWDLSTSTSLAFVGRTNSLPNTRTVGPSITTCKPGLRVRRELEKRRSFSPMPSSVNLSAPYSPTQHRQLRHFGAYLLQRTCCYLIKPPLYLMALMIKVAVQITRGAIRGSAYTYGEHGERIPCSWDFSSDESDADDNGWDEDDYGVKLGKAVSSKEIPTASTTSAWEID